MARRTGQGGIVIKGDEELRKNLKKLGGQSRPAMARGLKAAAEVIRRNIAARAPIAWLKENIIIKIVHDDDKGLAIIIGPRADEEHPYNIGIWFEFGVSPHQIPQGGGRIRLRIGNQVVIGPVDHPGIPAQPFMRPGFAASEKAALKAVEDEVKRALGL